jgi:hypothetical protein
LNVTTKLIKILHLTAQTHTETHRISLVFVFFVSQKMTKISKLYKIAKAKVIEFFHNL